jgi:uncharacterized protein YkwD
MKWRREQSGGKIGGENSGYNWSSNPESYKAIVKSWNNSPGHRKQMLSDTASSHAVVAVRDKRTGAIFWTDQFDA